jgi:hypothetical protein
LTFRNHRWTRKLAFGCTAIGVVVVAVLYGTGLGKDFRNLWANGTIPGLLFKPPNRTYDANEVGNLRAIRTALLLYHDSEGQFPQGAGWMDAIRNRIAVSDMDGSETNKKLIRPDLAGKPNQFGYALNDKAAGKYKDDAGPKTILVYESKQTTGNAHGNATSDRNGMAIDVDGTIER